ncbi:fatty acid desaturase [Rhodococcus sp. Leaf7]|uniref:acyl-ACP desaturase n=1 Tax=unclassified Rhodococcus (in: high G+C Gram-positive bacteria) TaxID=192944 RepID=UPI0006F28921|nr:MULTISPECIES: acyl-ACP desaturase [unclassified Rhodococcus (in: high G+C Gram-positive bacteria)]KQU06537.1 fatty acid desaturase [Rhodococcus sp. Leaf7]KQU42056.1 fatty acid desaturase [Rhodococcus sp. Leaf247]
MPKSDQDLLSELEVDAAQALQKHIDAAQDWQPHEYVPWDSGRNFAFLGGEDWSSDQVTLGDVDVLGATLGVLLADNLPEYHRDLAFALRSNDTWWKLLGRWTAEEFRHAIVLRNYLMTTRAVDPVELERVRIEHMTSGYSAPSLHVLHILAKFALDERAATVRHRMSASVAQDPLLASIFDRIAQDDDLQTTLFVDLVNAAIRVDADGAIRAIADTVASFALPSVELPGRGNSTELLAEAGLYDSTVQRDQVVAPLLEAWNVFGLEGLGEDGLAARAELNAALSTAS